MSYNFAECSRRLQSKTFRNLRETVCSYSIVSSVHALCLNKLYFQGVKPFLMTTKSHLQDLFFFYYVCTENLIHVFSVGFSANALTYMQRSYFTMFLLISTSQPITSLALVDEHFQSNTDTSIGSRSSTNKSDLRCWGSMRGKKQRIFKGREMFNSTEGDFSMFLP